MISDETLWSSGLSVLTNILNTSTDAVIIIDTLGVILRVNDMTVRMFGITSSGLIGQNVAILMPEPHHSLHDSYLRNRAGHVIGTEGRPLRALHADGRSFEVFLSVTGKPTAIAVTDTHLH